MDISIFLAKAIGLSLMLLCLVYFFNKKDVLGILHAYRQSPLMIFFSGGLSLLIGVLIILVHNIWTGDWRVIITLLGWGSLIKGLLRMLYAQRSPQLIKKITSNETLVTLTFFLTLLFSAFLIWLGFGR